MRIGLQIPSFTWRDGTAGLGAKLAEIARTADDAGFYSLWVMDHFFQIRGVGKPEEPMLEGYSALNFMAAVTKRAKLGTMVTGVIYREPALLIKAVTTLDVLSGGRAYLGIGAAWNEEESRALGFQFPPLAERFERLEEALQIAHQMWSGEVKPYNGKHYQLEQALNSPPALSKPHPPIMIGGMGEKKTLRFVAQYGDACNLFAFMGLDPVRAKLDVLKQHCADLGRPYEEIEKTVLSGAHLAAGQMSVSDVLNHCRALADIGIQQVIFNMPNVEDITPLEVFGREIIPAAAEF